MRRRLSSYLVIAIVLCVLAVPSFGITGFPADLQCPLCGEQNTLYVWASYGSYVFQWPSKFQLVFWPSTDPLNLFLCRKCHFAAFSDDWQKPPQEKFDATRKLLEGIPAPVIPKPELSANDKEEEKSWKRMVYAKVPVATRLEIAEKVYALWGRDEAWWCHYYRVKGYHLQLEKRLSEADVARQKALDLALKLLEEPSRDGRQKELRVVIAAMRHYLRQDAIALADLEAAAASSFKNSELTDEQNKNYDAYLSALIKEYILAIKERRSIDEKEDPQ